MHCISYNSLWLFLQCDSFHNFQEGHQSRHVDFGLLQNTVCWSKKSSCYYVKAYRNRFLCATSTCRSVAEVEEVFHAWRRSPRDGCCLEQVAACTHIALQDGLSPAVHKQGGFSSKFKLRHYAVDKYFVPSPTWNENKAPLANSRNFSP